MNVGLFAGAAAVGVACAAFGVPIDFVLFALTLSGVALFHHHTLQVALTGLDNIALKQGGYDWGMLAFAVGYGGSMIWFGSSAGVAISNMYPEAKSVGRWLAGGWHPTA